MEKETVQDSTEENSTDSVNINSIYFNKNCSIITVNLKTSSGPTNVIIPYKVDTCGNGNIMSLHKHKKLFPKITNEQLAATRNDNIQFKVYNKTTITQLGTCVVEL